MRMATQLKPIRYTAFANTFGDQKIKGVVSQ